MKELGHLNVKRTPPFIHMIVPGFIGRTHANSDLPIRRVNIKLNAKPFVTKTIP